MFFTAPLDAPLFSPAARRRLQASQDFRVPGGPAAAQGRPEHEITVSSDTFSRGEKVVKQRADPVQFQHRKGAEMGLECRYVSRRS